MDEEPDHSQDTLLGGRVLIRQRARGHRAGTDAVLLAAAAIAGPGEIVADIGAGSGAVGLMAASHAPECRLLLVERDPELARLCAVNIAANALGERALAIRADLLAGPVVAHASVDLVLTNPPFDEEGATRLSPEPRRSSAHVLPQGGFEAWIAACLRMLRPRGRIALIQRADKLDACLRHLAPQAGSIRLRAVHPRAGEDAIRVLVTAVKGGRAPLRISPPLILHEGEVGFTPAARALHGGATFAMLEEA